MQPQDLSELGLIGSISFCFNDSNYEPLNDAGLWSSDKTLYLDLSR